MWSRQISFKYGWFIATNIYQVYPLKPRKPKQKKTETINKIDAAFVFQDYVKSLNVQFKTNWMYEVHFCFVYVNVVCDAS